MKNNIKHVRNTVVLLFLIMTVLMSVSWTHTGIFEISSGYYGVDNDAMIISGIAPGVSEDDFLKRLYCEKNLDLTGGVKTDAVITNGHYSYALSVTGDLNGDGAVTQDDLIVMKSYMDGEKEFSEAEWIAADLDGDGEITILDFLQIETYLKGSGKIIGCKSEKAEKPENFYLLTKNESIKLAGVPDKNKTKFSSQDQKIADVDENGNVTAVSSGTTLITAKSGRDTVCTLVTVVDDEISVLLTEDSAVLTVGSEHEITAYLNHPAGMKITWQSSAPEVAEVSGDGGIKALAPGSTVITAELENGSRASAEITVICMAESISFDKELYKCKYGMVKDLRPAVSPESSNEPLIWESSDESIASVENGVVSGIDYGTVTITATAKYSGVSAACQVEVCDFKQIAITFDDGPGMYTMKLLDFLKENNIHATFFMIGNLVPRYEETVKRMAEDGNEIGYHSYDHAYQTSISLSDVTAKYQKTQEMLYNLCGRKATVWRSPGGYYNQDVLNAIKLPHIFWTVDTRDWEPKNQNTAFVKESILSQVEDGAIVLLHDIYSSTVDGAIEAIKVMLEEGDYEFLTVTELLSRHGEAPQASVSYRKG